MPANDMTVILLELVDEIRNMNHRLDQTNVEMRTGLADVRGEIRGTNERLDQTNERLDQTNERLDQTNQRLDQAIVEMRAGFADVRGEIAGVRSEIVAVELRQATRTTEQTAATRGLYAMLIDRLDLRDRVERCEHDIEALKSRR